MPYTQDTLASIVNQLAISLGDSNRVFWVTDELERYVREALRTWSAYANYWRGRRQFNTSVNSHYYNLATLGLVSIPGDQGPLLNDLQYAMVEPFSVVPPFNTFPTTEQYSAAQINDAILQALKQYQFDAGMTLTIESSVPIPIHPSYQAQLNENIADIRHVNIQIAAPGDPLNNKIFPLKRETEAEIQWFNTLDLADANIPYGYSVIFPQSQPTLRIFPPSSITGTLDIISIRSVSLPPIDFSWAAKWLALHFLLTQDGQSRDHNRAQYCKKRYDDALIVARVSPSYSVAYINNIPAPIVPARDMDAQEPGWRNAILAAGQEPHTVVDYGWNVVGVHPTPSAASPLHTISFDMFIEAPVTVDPIQIAPEHLQAVLDYAKHIAIFKLGGAEFTATMPLMERFVMLAIEYNSRLSAESRQLWTMKDRARRDMAQRYERRSAPISSEQLVSEGG